MATVLDHRMTISRMHLRAGRSISLPALPKHYEAALRRNERHDSQRPIV